MLPKLSSGLEVKTFPVDDVTRATQPIWSESLTENLSRRFMRKVVLLPEPTLPVINDVYDSHLKETPGYDLPLNGSANRCHPLINAVQLAFSQHRPLALSPDCVWLAIAQGFGHHVLANTEALRQRLVRHQGKQSLNATLPNWSLESCKLGIAALSEQIRDASDPVLHETLVCDFSTTTPETRTASQVVLMDTYSNYFKYEMTCVCGIPAISLAGSVADWQRIRERVEVLETFELQWWVRRLRPILEEFIETAKGRPDRKFWQAIYKPKKAYATRLVTGWITDLFPYLGDAPHRRRSHVFRWKRQNWIPAALAKLRAADALNDPNGVGTRAFPSGLCSVPFKLKLPENSTRELDLVAGFLGIEQDPVDLRLSPMIGWCVTEPAPQTPVLIG